MSNFDGETNRMRHRIKNLEETKISQDSVDGKKKIQKKKIRYFEIILVSLKLVSILLRVFWMMK